MNHLAASYEALLWAALFVALLMLFVFARLIRLHRFHECLKCCCLHNLRGARMEVMNADFPYEVPKAHSVLCPQCRNSIIANTPITNERSR